MQSLVDPIRYMSFRDLSGEVIHEVERKTNVLYIVVRKYVQDFISKVFRFDWGHLISLLLFVAWLELEQTYASQSISDVNLKDTVKKITGSKP